MVIIWQLADPNPYLNRDWGKGSRLIFLRHWDTCGDARWISDVLGWVDASQLCKPVESCNEENLVNTEELRVCGVQPIPRAREKEIRKDAQCSYQEPAQVPMLNKQRRVGRTQPRELGKLVVYLRYKPCL